jgi:hypothetical protein
VSGSEIRSKPIAFLAPIDQLIEEIKTIFQIQSHQANIPLTGKLADLQGIPVVKFKDSPWSVVYWSIGRASIIQDNCSTLSEKLSTKVLNLVEEDHSGWIKWFFYEKANELEIAERQVYSEDCEEIVFESSLRPDLEFDEDDTDETRNGFNQAVEDLLVDQKISIPDLDLELDSANIERIDLLVKPDFPLGMQECYNWIRQGHLEYSILGVKAPIDSVVQSLLDHSYIQSVEKQVQGDQSIIDLCRDRPNGVRPVIQPASNDWTIVYWAISYWEDLTKMAIDLSSELRTRVVVWGEEDTSSAFGYDIYENGEELERVEYCPGEDLMFSSKIREEPEFDDFETAEWIVVNRFINEIFIQEGIYIPSCDLAASDSYLSRVDFVLRK